MAHIAQITRYPIKGLTGENLSEAMLNIGSTLPQDRRYGIAHATSQIDEAALCWGSKKNFLNMAKDEKLGQLTAHFDDNARIVTLLRRGKKVCFGNIHTAEGRMVLEGMLKNFMPTGARGHARIVDGAEIHFTDQEQNFISLINLATVKDIERVVRKPVDPRRFRGNFYLQGLAAWAEQDLLGKYIAIGGAVLKAVMPIERCNAVNLDPDTGAIEVNIPLSLRRGYRHADCGIFLEVTQGGMVTVEDDFKVLEDA